MEKEKCEYCGKTQPGYNLVRVDFGNNEYVTLCNDCNNQDMALLLGIKDKKDFINSYVATDVGGEKHHFEIRKRIYPIGVCWEANEIKDGEMSGYQFAVHAELDADQDEALQKLHKKIRKGLLKRHIKKNTIYGHDLYSINDNEIIGRIDSNEGAPVFIIDGEEYTLEGLGKIVSSYEGFNFKLKIFDLTDDID